MESFYERGGGGNYESERLADLLKGRRLPFLALRFCALASGRAIKTRFGMPGCNGTAPGAVAPDVAPAIEPKSALV
jgi:hypothetical protein